jgi:hypothetical protein
MTTGEEVRTGHRSVPIAGSDLSYNGGPLAVVIPQSCTYQHFDVQGRFLVTSLELWDDRVIVHVHCPTAMEAAALTGILLQDNAGTRYQCASKDTVGRSAMLTFAPAAPEGIRTLAVRPQDPGSGSPSSGFVAAVRLDAAVPRGGRFRRLR